MTSHVEFKILSYGNQSEWRGYILKCYYVNTVALRLIAVLHRTAHVNDEDFG